jgi:hypothetical protein
LRVTVLLVAALVGGCAADTSDHTLQVMFDACEPLALVPGDGAEPAELASVDGAAEMWNRLGQTSLSRAIAAGAGLSLEIRFEEAAQVFHGVYDDEHGVVYINRRLSDPHQRAVTVAHEVGHALGLFHIADRESVMNPNNLELEPNQADADALVALWGACPPAASD